MTRRALFAALASLPFVGRFVRKPTPVEAFVVCPPGTVIGTTWDDDAGQWFDWYADGAKRPSRL